MTIILIYSGWIIDRLIISRPNLPVLSGGGLSPGLLPNFFILSRDEKIEKIEGENCLFDNTYVTGKLTFTIKSSNGTRQIGPYGYSGNPNGSDRWTVRETYTITNLNNLHLNNDRKGLFLGPIKNPRSVARSRSRSQSRIILL